MAPASVLGRPAVWTGPCTQGEVCSRMETQTWLEVSAFSFNLCKYTGHRAPTPHVRGRGGLAGHPLFTPLGEPACPFHRSGSRGSERVLPGTAAPLWPIFRGTEVLQHLAQHGTVRTECAGRAGTPVNWGGGGAGRQPGVPPGKHQAPSWRSHGDQPGTRVDCGPGASTTDIVHLASGGEDGRALRLRTLL